jgi:outer membrane protein assembly factor BamB
MKRLLLIFVTIAITSCSFDNKTGIWKDASNTPIENQNPKSITGNNSESRYEDIFVKNKTFDEEKEPSNPSNIKIDKPLKVVNWSEQYGIPSNNISNFYYADNKTLLTRSNKLSNSPSGKINSNRNIIFYKNNLISYDHNGTIFIYSLDLNKKIFKYNFYKKNFKNFNKEIYLTINENTLYVADNLGYMYAFNLDNNNIIWAKNYGIPFRSNLKFINNQIFLSNQDNLIYSINASTGNKNWQFATRPTYLKSDFENNFALDLINNNLFFFNTSGELYSINYTTQKFNWVLNFKNIALSEDTELFISQPIILKKNNLILTTEEALASYDHTTASRNWILSAEPIFKPILTLNYTYAILKNELLICIDNTNGSVIWSKNIFANVKKKKLKNFFKSIIDFKIVNSEVNIYFNNGYLLSFNPANGNLNHSSRISKSGIKSEIVFLNDNMLFIDSKNKLLKFN